MKAIHLLTIKSGLWAGILSGFAQTWTQTSAPTNLWSSITISADGTKLMVVAGGQFGIGPIYASTNSGADWFQTSAPSNHWYSVASSADGSKLAAATYGGVIYTSADSGTTWDSNNVPAHNWLSIASSADGSTLAAVFSTAQVFVSTNGGGNWVTNTTTTADLRCVVISADGMKLAAGNNVGRIIVSTDAGTTWTQPSSLVGNIYSLAASVDCERLIAIGTALTGLRVTYTSTNFAASWVSNNVPLNNSALAAATSADGTKCVIVSQKNGIFSSTNAGATWVTNDAPTLGWQTAVATADGATFFAAAYNGGIWFSQAKPAPMLTLLPYNGDLTLSWTIPSTNFDLQQSSDLANWSDVTNEPVLNLTNLQNQTTLPVSADSAFFRLATP